MSPTAYWKDTPLLSVSYIFCDDKKITKYTAAEQIHDTYIVDILFVFNGLAGFEA
jgi:hypothetical protein